MYLCHLQCPDMPLAWHANQLFYKQEYMMISEVLKYTINDKLLIMSYEGLRFLTILSELF